MRSDEKARESLFGKMTQCSITSSSRSRPTVEEAHEEEHSDYSEIEYLLISKMNVLTVGDVNKLSLLTFQLLAGYPLAGFAEHLVQWRFATQIGGNHYAPTKEFSHLIRFNRIDWSQARENLTFYAANLTTQNNSVYGQWAAVSIFMATGLPSDADQVSDTINRLIAGRDPDIKWNIKETFVRQIPAIPTILSPKMSPPQPQTINSPMSMNCILQDSTNIQR
ncbi:hypothetical protein GMW71_00050 [Pectobacterium brasiliense]|nr:hypothetical protein GMW71_00050 [Pectobacterium brasiliense]